MNTDPRAMAAELRSHPRPRPIAITYEFAMAIADALECMAAQSPEANERVRVELAARIRTLERERDGLMSALESEDYRWGQKMEAAHLCHEQDLASMDESRIQLQAEAEAAEAREGELRAVLEPFRAAFDQHRKQAFRISKPRGEAFDKWPDNHRIGLGVSFGEARRVESLLASPAPAAAEVLTNAEACAQALSVMRESEERLAAERQAQQPAMDFDPCGRRTRDGKGVCFLEQDHSGHCRFERQQQPAASAGAEPALIDGDVPAWERGGPASCTVCGHAELRHDPYDPGPQCECRHYRSDHSDGTCSVEECPCTEWDPRIDGSVAERLSALSMREEREMAPDPDSLRVTEPEGEARTATSADVRVHAAASGPEPALSGDTEPPIVPPPSGSLSSAELEARLQEVEERCARVFENPDRDQALQLCRDLGFLISMIRTLAAERDEAIETLKEQLQIQREFGEDNHALRADLQAARTEIEQLRATGWKAEVDRLSAKLEAMHGRYDGLNADTHRWARQADQQISSLRAELQAAKEWRPRLNAWIDAEVDRLSKKELAAGFNGTFFSGAMSGLQSLQVRLEEFESARSEPEREEPQP